MSVVKHHKSPAPNVIDDRAWSEVCEQFRRAFVVYENGKRESEAKSDDCFKKWNSGYAAGQKDGFLQAIAALYGNSFALAVCESVGVDDPVGFW